MIYKKKKMILYSMGSVAALAAPALAVISCSWTNEISYDFGIASQPINSLNYIKNVDTFKIAPSLIDPLFKSAPNNSDLKNILNLPQLKLNYYDKSSGMSGNYTPLSDYGFTSAVLHDSNNSFPSFVGLISNSNRSSIYATGYQLNEGKSVWSNGDKVVAQDFVDSLKYILDINSGSQLITKILETKIKNANEIFNAQSDYYAKFGQTYIDPFGYNGNWDSQIEDDEKYVDKIKKAAMGLGAYTGLGIGSDFGNKKDIHSFAKNDLTGYGWANNVADYEHDINEKTLKKKNNIDVSAFNGDGKEMVDKKYQLFIEYEPSTPTGLVPLISNIPTFFPINRKFVESIGGISKFGTDKKSFIWNGPFNPSEMALGPQGYMILSKRYDYFDSGRTISDKIKIFFQDDPVIKATMFDDGIIAHTSIPASYMMKLWADPKTRRFMKKSGGFGTIAFSLNLDKESNNNKALLNPDFRRALSYGLDRNSLLKLVGWDASFPVTNFTAFGQVIDTKGNPLETYFDNEKFKPYDGFSSKDKSGNIISSLPIQSFPWLIHTMKNNKFESVDRTDIGFIPSVAKRFMNKFKKENPNIGSVKLEYIYDGGQEGRKAGVALQDQLTKIFGGFVKVHIKGLPRNVFEQYKSSGKYDILYANYDAYGSLVDGYVKRFFTTDGIDKKAGKSNGFYNNPSGSWTYKSYFESPEVKNKDAAKIKQLMTKKELWNKAKELSYRRTNETKSDYDKRVGSFFTKSSYKDSTGISHKVDPKFTTDKNIFALVALMEKIIRDGTPIIPLMEVDTQWSASRIAGAGNLYTYSLQYAYDVDRKPNPLLPGREALK